MPVSYVVTDEGRVVIEKWLGSISHEEVVSHERAQLKDTRITPGAVVLADCISASFETPMELIHELTQCHAEPDNKTSLSRCAIVIGSKDFDKARRFESQASVHGMTVVVFFSTSLDSACRWLGLDPADVARHVEQLMAELKG